jgi:hypothetical protein
MKLYPSFHKFLQMYFNTFLENVIFFVFSSLCFNSFCIAKCDYCILIPYYFSYDLPATHIADCMGYLSLICISKVLVFLFCKPCVVFHHV